jgi:hypothetical protein
MLGNYELIPSLAKVAHPALTSTSARVLVAVWVDSYVCRVEELPLAGYIPQATGVREIPVNAPTITVGTAKGAMDHQTKGRTTGARSGRQLYDHRK